MSFKPGFDPAEARALLAICYDINCNTTGVTPPPEPPPPVNLPAPPKPGTFGWELAYDPGRVVFADNYWQLWKNKNKPGQYALAFRGTTTNMDSIEEDIAAFLVPASLTIRYEGKPRTVRLAEDPLARVHVGFASGLTVMLADPALNDNILFQLLYFAKVEGMTDLFIIGHSQGAALATLCHSFLHYQDAELYLNRLNLKSYVFAQPKPGNKHYAYDYERISSYSKGTYSPMGFRITSDQDWVPQAPLSLEVPHDASQPNPFTIIPKFINQRLKKIMKELEALDVHFDFQSAGCPIMLRAKPGLNPDAPEKDYMWQHHAKQYYRYLKAQYPVPAETDESTVELKVAGEQ